MNSEFEKPKKISASKYAGTCDVAAVRHPSLSLVFYKEKRDKQSI